MSETLAFHCKCDLNCGTVYGKGPNFFSGTMKNMFGEGHMTATVNVWRSEGSLQE